MTPTNSDGGIRCHFRLVNSLIVRRDWDFVEIGGFRLKVRLSVAPWVARRGDLIRPVRVRQSSGCGGTGGVLLSTGRRVVSQSVGCSRERSSLRSSSTLERCFATDRHARQPAVQCMWPAGRAVYYDTMRDAIFTCARKPTWVSLIYRTETTSKKCKTEKN